MTKKTKEIFDPHVPQKLKKTQIWFASIITRAIDESSHMNPISPSGVPMTEEAKHYVAPSPTLKPHQRIELYNQQYWWRLLSTLHEIFPLVTRLFGYAAFNQTIGFPYLEAYPPNHWSLNPLGSRLPQWIQESYQGDDQDLILHAAQIDSAFNDAFLTEQFPPLDMSQLPNPQDISSILPLPLKLQPHIQLFKLPYDLFSFRFEMLKEGGDYWVDHEFPEIDKKHDFYFVLYRNQNNDVSWSEIGKTEYLLLNLFKEGISIDDACFELEQQDGDTYRDAIAHLAEWFQKWTQRSWLYLK